MAYNNTPHLFAVGGLASSPARERYQAGLKKNDVVISVNGQSILHYSHQDVVSLTETCQNLLAGVVWKLSTVSRAGSTENGVSGTVSLRCGKLPLLMLSCRSMFLLLLVCPLLSCSVVGDFCLQLTRTDFSLNSHRQVWLPPWASSSKRPLMQHNTSRSKVYMVHFWLGCVLA